MIIKITTKSNPVPQTHIFQSPKQEILVGRNPKSDDNKQKIVVDAVGVSRSHLLIKLKNGCVRVMDLGSRNGTRVNSGDIVGNQWVDVGDKDEVVLGDSEVKITIQKRNVQESQSSQQQQGSSSSSSPNRSRQKPQKQSLQQLCKCLKISESTLKMLKQMTCERKPKQQKIKFLKLMGCKNIEPNWELIETHLKDQNKYNNNSKKAAEELQKQFDSGRGGFEKKGLGRK